MEPEMKKPFKTVTTEYFEEIGSRSAEGIVPLRRIRVVTTTTEYCGSQHDPIVTRVSTYL